MKTRLIFLVILIACISCGTNNKPVSDAQKEKIKGEVKEVVNTFIKGCEEANPDMAAEPLFDSPDFVYILNGRALSYRELVDGMRPNFSKFFNQNLVWQSEIRNTTIFLIDLKYDRCGGKFSDNRKI